MENTEKPLDLVSPPSDSTTPPTLVATNTPTLPPQITIDDFAKVALRVAKIENAENLPKSKKLIKLKVSLGEYGERQILAGIAQYYQPEQLIGRKIVVIANLAPAKLMGEESQGMLLAASIGDKLTIIDPGQDMEPGAEVR